MSISGKRNIKSIWHYRSWAALAYTATYMLMQSFMPLYAGGYFGGLLAVLLAGEIVYKKIVQAKAAATNRQPAASLGSLIAADKWLGVLLGSAFFILLAVSAVFLVKSLNIFIIMPVAAVLGGLAGYGLHRRLQKN